MKKAFQCTDLVIDLETKRVGTVISARRRETQEKLGPWGMMTTHVMIRTELEILWSDGTVGTKTDREVEKLK